MRVMVSIRRDTLDEFWIRAPVTVMGSLITMEKSRKLYREDFGLEEWLPTLGTYPLNYEVGTGLACMILRLSLRNGRNTGHL